MPARNPTPSEYEFVRSLLSQVEDLQDWYHNDADGAPWLMVSYDFTNAGWITGTLRLDFDGARLVGGWSPAALNWDAEMRAEDAGIVIQEPEGLSVAVSSPSQAADVAARWFRLHIQRRESASQSDA
jgi:hypothetical protein